VLVGIETSAEYTRWRCGASELSCEWMMATATTTAGADGEQAGEYCLVLCSHVGVLNVKSQVSE
jgi:hypothetical protein